MVTHPCINWARDCLTSVIKHKTFAPCYVSPHRSIPFFSKEQVILKPREKKFIKIEALFVDEILGLAIVKMLDSKEQMYTGGETEIYKKTEHHWTLQTIQKKQ